MTGVKEVTVVKEVMACDVSWRLASGDGLDINRSEKVILESVES